ncbi:glycosyltransferase family 25 protein [Caballeronia sp. 15715]|uniref:glycosyltransferase family 25 protein n=1 Tax=Caballeronia sp. 15715 TaxID=3391030 RepID=UPI0039E657F3
MTIGTHFVCISLERARERRALMARQFQAHGIDVQFFSGIEPRSPADAINESDFSARMRRYGRPMSEGEIGCYLSHREVWKQLVDSGDDAWCIMEDDIALRSGFVATVWELASNRDHWDVVRLMGLNRNERIPYAKLPSGTQLMWMDRQPVGLQCYMLTRAGAAALLAHTHKIVHAIDTAVDRHWEHKLRLFVTEPEYVETVDMVSTVGFRPGITSLSTRVREKIYRRIDKTMAALYNAKRRPQRPIHLSQNAIFTEHRQRDAHGLSLIDRQS